MPRLQFKGGHNSRNIFWPPLSDVAEVLLNLCDLIQRPIYVSIDANMLSLSLGVLSVS